jgi:hypothetical protein
MKEEFPGFTVEPVKRSKSLQVRAKEAKQAWKGERLQQRLADLTAENQQLKRRIGT